MDNILYLLTDMWKEKFEMTNHVIRQFAASNFVGWINRWVNWSLVEIVFSTILFLSYLQASSWEKFVIVVRTICDVNSVQF